MIVICNIYKSVGDLLPHFYIHYLSYGVTKFLFGLHSGTDNPVYQQIHDLAPPGTNVEIVESYRGQICGKKEGESLNNLRRRAQSDWVIPADLDEFHVPYSFDSFALLKDYCEERKFDCVLSALYDMISPDGSIPPSILPDIPIAVQFPLHVGITATVIKGMNQKVLSSRQSLSLSDGHHNVGLGRIFDETSRRAPQLGKTLHYKWFGNLWEKEEEKYRSYKELGYDYSEENLRLLDHLRSHNGKLL